MYVIFVSGNARFVVFVIYDPKIFATNAEPSIVTSSTVSLKSYLIYIMFSLETGAKVINYGYCKLLTNDASISILFRLFIIYSTEYEPSSFV